jgi:serine phosphatase RsbU (regulator of sigma subunit)
VRLDEQTVSRRHAELRRAASGWVVADLGTQNGTFVNGKRIAGPTPLKRGDELTLGGVTLRFEDAAPGVETLQPVSDVKLVEHQGAGADAVVVRMDASSVPVAPAEAARSRELMGRLQFLYDLAGDLGGTFDEGVVLERILGRLFEVLPQAERGFILLKAPDHSVEPRAVRSRSGDATGLTISRTLVSEVMEKRQGLLSMDALGDTRFTRSASMVGLAIRSLICVPIIADNEVLGALQVDSTQKGMPFDEGELALVLAVSRQLALSLQKARLHARVLEEQLLHHDLALAGRLQQRFLPRALPEVPGYAFAVEYAAALEVGGDLYAFLELADGRVGIAVGDVSGKGVSAALCMAKLSSDLRIHAVGEKEPSVILDRVNRALCDDLEEGMFVTVALLVLDPRTGELQVARAGHPAPLLRDAAGTLVELGTPGDSPLGVSPEATFAQQRYELDPSDVVLVFTDGVTEAQNRKFDLFGDYRLGDSIRRAGPSPEAVRDRVLADVEAFVAGHSQNDDLTLVCFGRE